MSLKPIKQEGFTVVEGLLILLILAILGGTGYYIYQANNEATDTQNQAQTNANSATPPNKEKAEKAKSDTNSAETENTTENTNDSSGDTTDNTAKDTSDTTTQQ